MSGDDRIARLRIRLAALSLSLCIFASQSAMAFDYPIQEEHIREAYFLGRTTNNEKLIDFYGQYVRHLPFPDRGPYYTYVESVEFRTPYEQIVLRSRQNLNQYSSLEAAKDYRADPGLVIVRVLISYKTNYSGPILPASGFKIRVLQAGPMEPKKSTIEQICSLRDDCGVTRFAILLWFDAEQFAPGTARVKIATPDGQVRRTEFDLDKLI